MILIVLTHTHKQKHCFLSISPCASLTQNINVCYTLDKQKQTYTQDTKLLLHFLIRIFFFSTKNGTEQGNKPSLTTKLHLFLSLTDLTSRVMAWLDDDDDAVVYVCVLLLISSHMFVSLLRIYQPDPFQIQLRLGDENLGQNTRAVLSVLLCAYEYYVGICIVEIALHLYIFPSYQQIFYASMCLSCSVF